MRANPLEHLISVIAPSDCHICKVEGYMLCLNCRMSELSNPDSRCYLCNKLTSSNTVCSSCRSSSRIRRVWWLGEYDAVIKELIHDLKYNRKRAYAREFGEILAESLPYLSEDTVVVPVPTASSRVRMRGFDQSVLIAEALGSKRSLKVSKSLRRTTQVDQIGKRRAERLEQMKNSLSLTSTSGIKGKSVLIVDDVLTTGATLEAAAALLRAHGAKHVDAVIVARHLLS